MPYRIGIGTVRAWQQIKRYTVMSETRKEVRTWKRRDHDYLAKVRIVRG